MEISKIVYGATILLFGWLGYQLFLAPASGSDIGSQSCSTHRMRVATLMQGSDSTDTAQAARIISDNKPCFDGQDVIWADSWLDVNR